MLQFRVHKGFKCDFKLLYIELSSAYTSLSLKIKGYCTTYKSQSVSGISHCIQAQIIFLTRILLKVHLGPIKKCFKQKVSDHTTISFLICNYF